MVTQSVGVQWQNTIAFDPRQMSGMSCTVLQNAIQFKPQQATKAQLLLPGTEEGLGLEA